MQTLFKRIAVAASAAAVLTSGTVIAAFYKDGRLNGLSYTDTALGCGIGNIELRPGALEFDTVKLMMWDDLNKMIPAFEVFEYKGACSI